MTSHKTDGWIASEGRGVHELIPVLTIVKSELQKVKTPVCY